MSSTYSTLRLEADRLWRWEESRADSGSCPNAEFDCFVSVTALLDSFISVRSVFLEPRKFSSKNRLRWNSVPLPGKIDVFVFDMQWWLFGVSSFGSAVCFETSDCVFWHMSLRSRQRVVFSDTQARGPLTYLFVHNWLSDEGLLTVTALCVRTW